MDLPGVLARSPHILLDFDGPMCQVFTPSARAEAARSLAGVLRDAGTPVPDEVCDTGDPFAVLRYVATHASHLVHSAERALTRLELAAVASAVPAPALVATLDALHHAGRTVTVISNHSASAVETFVAIHALNDRIVSVAARTDPNPALLKPNPHLLRQAAAELGTTPASCVMIGDSLTDVAAAHRAGTSSIAFANDPDRLEALRSVRPDALIEELTQVIDALPGSEPADPARRGTP